MICEDCIYFRSGPVDGVDCGVCYYYEHVMKVVPDDSACDDFKHV